MKAALVSSPEKCSEPFFRMLPRNTLSNIIPWASFASFLCFFCSSQPVMSQIMVFAFIEKVKFIIIPE
jgi:hypothetical protein